MEDLSRNRIAVETYKDDVFIKHIVKEVQKIEPEVGGIFFPSTNILVFYWNRIFIDKIILDKVNLDDIKFKEHVERISRTIRMIKLRVLDVREVRKMQGAVQNFNSKKTGKIIT